ncbi:MAG: DUF4364 family protein [Oscillospiraceae bacterium]|nr:DUF4364 family protein [Oscillospiraceae bacterium]
MARHGYIRSKLDIKLLILCFLSNMQNLTASFDHLTELSLIDGAVDYFEFCQSLSELVDGEQVQHTEDGRYRITANGLNNYKVCENDLVLTVRRKAVSLAQDVVNRIQRDKLIHSSSEPRQGGDYTVHMRLNDLKDNILAIDMMVTSEEHAKQMRKNFEENAEKIYNAVLRALLEE